MKIFAVAAVLLVAVLALRATSVPPGAQEYLPEHALLPGIEHSGDSVRITNVRVFRYTDGVVSAGHVTREIDLRDVTAAWYVLSPFASWRGPAHAFLSFELADSTYLAVSVEARREVGEEYSPLRGLLRGYELMYVIGDEPDLIGLRTDLWNDPVYLYPTAATPAQARRLLEALLARASALATRPEYYHTIGNNCATNLAAALNAIAPGRAPRSLALVLPGYSDTYAWKRGLLALDGPPDQVRERYRINPRERDAAAGSFSRRIRERP